MQLVIDVDNDIIDNGDYIVNILLNLELVCIIEILFRLFM